MARRLSTKPTRRNSRQERDEEIERQMLGGSLFDAFDGYKEDWPGVYEPKKKDIEVIKQLFKRERWSPDFKKLKLNKNILLFVCDELVYLGNQHKHISGSKYLGKAMSMHDSYALRGTKFAILQDHVTSKSERAKIKGEIYCVSPETMLLIDNLKFNGVMTQREQRTFFLKDQNYPTKQGKRVPSIKAWVYLAKKECWNNAENMPLMARYCYAGLKDKMYYEYFPRTSIFPERPYHAPYPMDQRNDHWHEHVG